MNNSKILRLNDNGEKTVWTRFGDHSLFEIGRRVKLEYVVQKPKKSWTGSPHQNEVLKISIEVEIEGVRSADYSSEVS